MYIHNESLREVLESLRDNKPLDKWYVNYLLDKVEASEKREEERRQRKREEYIALCRKIHSLFAEDPCRRLCPTDLQFMLYNRFGLQCSCVKVARACNNMSWYKPAWFPADILDLVSVPHHENKGGDDHAYYYLSK